MRAPKGLFAGGMHGGMSLAEIAEVTGLSHERVRQIIKKALKKMRLELLNRGIGSSINFHEDGFASMTMCQCCKGGKIVSPKKPYSVLTVCDAYGTKRCRRYNRKNRLPVPAAQSSSPASGDKVPVAYLGGASV